MRPDVKTVAVSRVDGGVTILRIIETSYHEDGSIRRQVEVTPEYVEGQIKRYVDGGSWRDGQLPTSWRFVPNDYLDDSTDVTYRNAWKDAPGRNKPDHDMPKARELHRGFLRRARLRPMDDLDIQYQKADEAGDQAEKRSITARKQKLRDVTADPRIEAAQTVEELKVLTFEELTR